MAENSFITQQQITPVIDELVITHGEAEQPRIARCAHQVARLWRAERQPSG